MSASASAARGCGGGEGEGGADDDDDMSVAARLDMNGAAREEIGEREGDEVTAKERVWALQRRAWAASWRVFVTVVRAVETRALARTS